MLAILHRILPVLDTFICAWLWGRALAHDLDQPSVLLAIAMTIVAVQAWQIAALRRS